MVVFVVIVEVASVVSDPIGLVKYYFQAKYC